MDLILLDTSFNTIAIIDTYESLIWTDRYQEAGDFELYLASSYTNLNLFQKNRYLWCKESEHLMIIEGISLSTDAENGNHLTVTGRSLESILDRRIIWTQTDLNNVNFQTAVQRILNENVINPSAADRKISNFIFESSSDSYISSLRLTAQYTGDNLYDVIVTLCKLFGLGFSITLNDGNQMVFKFYNGLDRSYEQTANTYVIFSSEFDNIINSNYAESDKELKNVTLVAGEGEGLERRTVTVGTGSGLDRRELFTDARDLQQGTETDSVYIAMLEQRGEEKLAETQSIKSFDGEVDYLRMFVYGVHYRMGDICEIVNDYGLESRVRVIEVVRSYGTEGYKLYPTFSSV